MRRVVLLIGFVAVLTMIAPTKVRSAPPARIAAITLSWDSENRDLAAVLAMLRKAAAERAQIVCLPQECVSTDGGAAAEAALAAIAKVAAEGKMVVAANLLENAGGKRYCTSYLIGPDGKTLGKYRKSHRMPDEEIALGDELPVFDTPYGKVGLMVGTDHYWPEIPLVLALKGAELILWSTAPQSVPQSAPLDVKMRVRALDNHLTLACADYAGELPYLCSNYPAYTGAPLGRSYIVDRSGMVVADTGIHTGVAAAPVDLHRPKDIYWLTFHEDRGLFRDLVDPKVKPAVHRGGKRQIRVALAQVSSNHGPSPEPDSAFARILDEAGAREPDVILMGEFGFPTDTPAAAKTFALVAEKAKKYGSYVIIGGLRDPDLPNKQGRATSWAYLWDRAGKIAGKYRISQYGLSQELPVFQTDFGVIGLMLCGDIYSPEICRAMALKGAEIIFCGSQSWGPSGTFNRWMQETRAIDNGIYMATCHFPFSDTAQRSYVIDPYGQVLAATPYWREGVVTADVDLDAGQIWFARSDKPGRAGQKGYLHAYYPKTIPEQRTDLRSVLLAGRRPKLYGAIVEKTLAERDYSDALKDRMGVPR